MPYHDTRKFVPYTPEQMFNVVADVEAYPQFVPYCSGLRVLFRNQQDSEKEVIHAEMTVKYLMFQERFTSNIQLDRTSPKIDVTLLSGPFNYLTNNWAFQAADGGTDIEFRLHYAFKSTMLALIAGVAFEKLFENFVDAFERRAGQIYGNSYP